MRDKTKTKAQWLAHLSRLAMVCGGAALCLALAPSAFGQQTSPPQKTTPQAKPPAAPSPASPPAASEPNEDQPPPGDWAPELLYSILNANQDAQDNLLRAAFAAGPAILPQLEKALQDDRTAEFAAQSVAYIGGNDAAPILWKLLSDTRDLNLRRFTYGALGEFDSPQATDMLFNVIEKSDDEPDRTVTECAVIALTVRTDAALLPRIEAAEAKLHDIVIHDDLDNAREVIAERAKYLATPEGKKAGGSIRDAVRTYFIPALETPGANGVGATPAAKSGTGKTAAPNLPPLHPLVSVEVRNVTYSPDKERALARVVFDDPSASANYDFILQKRYGNWTIASVWLGAEVEKPGADTHGTGPAAAPSSPDDPN